jgi:hypothetical protein
MASAWIVEAIDVLEYGSISLTSGFPAVAPDQLALERFEERFHHGIIVAITFAAHAVPSGDCVQSPRGIP